MDICRKIFLTLCFISVFSINITNDYASDYYELEPFNDLPEQH